MLSLPISLPLTNRFVLIIAPAAAWQEMLQLSAHLCLQGPLRIFDGGNRTNVYWVARAIRRQSPDVNACLAHIRLSRAFTCYQMLNLLKNACVEQQPILVLDLLATFYDENISLAEAQNLLQLVLQEFERFRCQSPLVVSARSTAPSPERGILLEQLAEKADQVLVCEPGSFPPATSQQTQLTFPF